MRVDLVKVSDAAKALQAYYDNEHGKLDEHQAKIMLAMLRKMLAQHNTGRHEIKINAGMGVAGVWIDDIAWYEFGRTMPMSGWRPGFPVVATIDWIHDNLDWQWAAYLNGAILNPKDSK